MKANKKSEQTFETPCSTFVMKSYNIFFSAQDRGQKKSIGFWIQSARRVLPFRQSKLLLNQQMRKSFSGRKRVLPFCQYHTFFLRRRITNENRCDKISDLVSVKESFHVLCLAYYSEQYLCYSKVSLLILCRLKISVGS